MTQEELAERLGMEKNKKILYLLVLCYDKKKTSETII